MPAPLVEFIRLIEFEERGLGYPTPVLVAIYKKKVAKMTRIFRYIVQHRELDIDEADDRGNTPLMVCCDLKMNKLAFILLAFGADVAKRNAAGKTALQICCDNGAVLIAIKLLDHMKAADIDKEYVMTHCTLEHYLRIWDPYHEADTRTLGPYLETIRNKVMRKRGGARRTLKAKKLYRKTRKL